MTQGLSFVLFSVRLFSARIFSARLFSARVAALFLGLACLSVGAERAEGQARRNPARPNHASARGLEIALFGSNRVELGGIVRAEGIAYAVDGLATMSPLERGSITAQITRLRDRGDVVDRETVSEVRTSTRAGGRFSIEVAAPSEAVAQPMLEIEVTAQGASRRFLFPITLESGVSADLLTDRVRYEAGETIHLWSRTTRRTDGAPTPGKTLSLEITDARGRVIGTQRGETARSGAAVFAFTIPAETEAGSLHIVVRSDNVLATRDVVVGRRTVERIFATMRLDQEIVAPGGRLTGAVHVTAPSGAPIAGARVELTVGDGGASLVLETARDGRATFEMTAPAFLSGEVGAEAVTARVMHPAYGAIGASAAYVLSRVAWVIRAQAETGALVPELDQAVYLSVTDPKGRPAPEGLSVIARGVGVAQGEQQATTDAHGIARVSFRVPKNALATLEHEDGMCAGSVATTFDAEIAGPRAQVAHLCVAVSKDAQVAPSAVDAVVRPGETLTFDVKRRPAARGVGVIAEALAEDRAIGWTWLSRSESRGAIALPSGFQGVITLRIRPLSAPSARAPSDQPGTTSAGIGASIAVLVRPVEAFDLTLDPERSRYQVRETARVSLRPSTAPGEAYATLVVRDLAMHGGESPWELSWMRSALDRAATASGSERSGHLLRAALASVVTADFAPPAPAPTAPPIYRRDTWGSVYTPEQGISRGELRDPIALREEMLRRGAAQTMVQLEQVVAELDPNDEESVAGLLTKQSTRQGTRIGFDDDVLAHLVEAGRLNEVRTLGDVPARVSMLPEADPGFSYDAVGKRVARLRLVRLLAALTALTDPDNADAARAIYGEPPERWLSKLLALGLIESTDLVDPWGHPFQLRAAGSRGPAIVVAQRAPNHELLSAGPDGAFGTGDDIRDPFARMLSKGSPYAIASGEDALMEQLAAIGPGPAVLAAMLAAFSAESLEAQDEREEGLVSATESEGMEYGGVGAGYAESEMNIQGQMAAPSVAMGSAAGGRLARRAASHEAAMLDASEPAPGAPPPSPLAVLSEVIRERFPATLFFVGEVPLNSGAAIDIPLQDALTTYRVEAIAWSRAGWVTGAAAELQVDRDVTIDAPVPPFAIEGDVLRLPVRLRNQGEHAVRARFDVSAENLELARVSPIEVEVGAGESVEKVLELRVAHAGQGHVVIRAVRAQDGTPLDAVRRPLTVFVDHRVVRGSQDVWIQGTAEIAASIPEGASVQGSDSSRGSLQITPGTRLLGDPEQDSDPGQAAWALAFAQRPIPEAMRSVSISILSGYGDSELYWSDGLVGARAIAVAWNDPRVDDERILSGFRALSAIVGRDTSPQARIVPPPIPSSPAEVLLALTPAARSSARPALHEERARLIQWLSDAVEREASAVSESPEMHARAAAALAWANPAWANPESRARASEFLRRAEPQAFRVGDLEWIESDRGGTDVGPRIQATSYLGLARVALGSGEAALRNLRVAIASRRGAARWPSSVRALAMALGGVVSGGAWDPAQARVFVDGVAKEVRVDGESIQVALPEIGRSGSHVIRVVLPAGAVGLGRIARTYGVPWSQAPGASLPIALSVDGAVGARDRRAGLSVEVKNRGARVLARPVLEIDMPAGAELDEPTRESLASHLRSPAMVEGRVLRLPLRPIGPGGYLRLPIPIRWAVGGTLRGLGAVLYDEAMPETLQGRPVAILASRAVEIPDRGEEAAPREHERSPEPVPPPPPPVPMPRPLPIDASEVVR